MYFSKGRVFLLEETIIDSEGINEEDYVHIDSEATDELAHRPAELYIKRTIRRKFALKDHSAVIIAPLPASAIHKCMADTTGRREYSSCNR